MIEREELEANTGPCLRVEAFIRAEIGLVLFDAWMLSRLEGNSRMYCTFVL